MMTDAIISRVHGSTVLIVSSKNALQTRLAKQLREQGIEVVTVERAEEGLLRVETLPPQLVVADEHVLDEPSLDACRKMQQSMQRSGGLLLLLSGTETATSQSAKNGSPIQGQAVPRRAEQLVHGIVALLASASGDTELDTERSHEGLCLDRQRQRATSDGQILDVTPTEFRMLWALVEHPGFVLSREELMEASRGLEVGTHGRTIDAHIRSIRKKLGSRAKLVETVRGYGYRLSETLTEHSQHESAPIPSVRSWPA